MGKRKLAYADSSQSKIQKLTTFGFSSNAGSNESAELIETNNFRESNEASDRKKF